MDDTFTEIALRERFGWIALDFVNTTVLTRTGPTDAFHDVEQLHSWMDLAAPPGWEDLRPHGVPERRTLHAEAVRLRVAIDHFFSATVGRNAIQEPTVHALRRVVRWATTSTDLRVEASGHLSIATRYEALHPAAALAPIVDDAVRLVASVNVGRLRRCRAGECLRWFVDTSKGGRRAWCSMATCGNRAKAARYRARHDPEAAQA